jgi:VCBS repeat-containing protein
VTATVALPQDATAGDTLTVNSVDRVLSTQDIATGHVDYQVHPGDGVIAILTDQAGNQSNLANVQLAALAPDRPTFVAPPVIHNYGVPTISAAIGGGSSGSGGWALQGPNGQPVQQMAGKYGTLTIDPQTGQLNYEYSHAATMGQKASGGTHSAGQVISQTDHDVFHVLLHSAIHGDVDVEVNVNIQFIHGRSGQNIDSTKLVGMTISDPADAQQHDEIPDQSDDVFSVTVDIMDEDQAGSLVVDYLGFAATGGAATADQTLDHAAGATTGDSPLNAYLHAAGLDPSQVGAGQEQGAEPSLDPALLDDSAVDHSVDGRQLAGPVEDMSDVEIPDHVLDPDYVHHDG